MENVYKAIDEVIDTIINSNEYKTCISLKEKMSTNTEVMNLIENIKKMQKKYIRSEYDKEIKETLDSLEKQLNDIPIYAIYLENLSKVNEMIEYVKESLNEYFYQLLNKKY